MNDSLSENQFNMWTFNNRQKSLNLRQQHSQDHMKCRGNPRAGEYSHIYLVNGSNPLIRLSTSTIVGKLTIWIQQFNGYFSMLLSLAAIFSNVFSSIDNTLQWLCLHQFKCVYNLLLAVKQLIQTIWIQV